MSVNTSELNNTTLPPAASISPQEAALQSLCKQILKSRLFRGFYEERLYVDEVKGYRDIVSLHRSEKELNRLIKDIRDKLQMFYCHQNPNIWIGVTCGPITGCTINNAALDTFIWAEMDDLAFGQYWFSIKSLKFRDNEVIIRLKMVRPVDAEEMSEKWTKTSSTSRKSDVTKTTTATTESSRSVAKEDSAVAPVETEINLKDFANILEVWWCSIKQTIYDFMAKDISKENMKGVLRFLGLLMVSILSGAFVSIKFLGYFAIRFMFELSRMTHVLTPVLLKIIDFFSKIVGGFYLLLAMIWKDTVVHRGQRKQAALEYNRPMRRSIEYQFLATRQDRGSPKPMDVVLRRTLKASEEM